MQIPTFKMIKSNVRGLYEGTHPDPDSVPSLVDTWCDALADDRANHAAQITTLTAEIEIARQALDSADTINKSLTAERDAAIDAKKQAIKAGIDASKAAEVSMAKVRDLHALAKLVLEWEEAFRRHRNPATSDYRAVIDVNATHCAMLAKAREVVVGGH